MQQSFYVPSPFLRLPLIRRASAFGGVNSGSIEPQVPLTEAEMDALLARLDAALAGRVRRIAVLLPYDKLGEATPMRENGTVLTEEYRPEGVYLEGIVKTMDLHRFTPYLV